MQMVGTKVTLDTVDGEVTNDSTIKRILKGGAKSGMRYLLVFLSNKSCLFFPPNESDSRLRPTGIHTVMRLLSR